MTVLARETTIPAYPLGQPLDGRPRYGMTPEQANVYAWLVKHRPHNAPFRIGFRAVARSMITSPSKIHDRVQALQERGWVRVVDARPGHSTYAFVQPIKWFREPLG